MKTTSTGTVSGSRVWFITGAARGLGRAFTRAALDAGDRVIGVARDVSGLEDLAAEYDGRFVSFPLDVADRNAVFMAVEKAIGVFGRLDIVVNNAGVFLFGMIEEATEAQIRSHMDINFFGALWVSQAVIPHLRKQGSGHILQVSSMGSSGGFASVGFYGAGKAALDAMSEAFTMEVEPFGIQVTILQPGGYRTELFTRGTALTEEHPAYAGLREELSELWSQSEEAEAELAAGVVMKVAGAENPPKRLILGGTAYDQVQELIRVRLQEYARWEHLSREAG